MSSTQMHKNYEQDCKWLPQTYVKYSYYYGACLFKLFLLKKSGEEQRAHKRNFKLAR